MEGTYAVLLVLVLAVAGALVYFVLDYMNHQKDVKQKLELEQISRTATVQYVINNVNKANRSIDTDIQTASNNIQTANNNQNKIVSAFGRLMTISSNLPAGSTGASEPISLLNMPGSGAVNINLLQRVNATMGLTARNLSPSNAALFCSVEQPNRCIRLPNADGNLYFTPMTSNVNSSIILDAPKVESTGRLNTSNLSVMNELQVGNSSTPVRIRQEGDSVVIQANRIVVQGDLDVRGRYLRLPSSNA